MDYYDRMGYYDRQTQRWFPSFEDLQQWRRLHKPDTIANPSVGPFLARLQRPFCSCPICRSLCR